MTQAELKLSLADKYPNGWYPWIRDNQHIWEAFRAKAIKMAAVRKHYSARCIIENIRYETDLQDTDKQFRINGNYVPGLARKFMEIYGHKWPNFFSLRDSMGMDE